MEHISKKGISLLLSIMLLLSFSGITTFAESENTMSVTLRIEGIHANMFYKTIEVPYTGSLTLQAALQFIDTQENSIAITGVDSGYISCVNGETVGQFGGWDGWLYKVNDKELVVGIDGYALNDGDSILLYYGDPFGIGMQYPVADTSKISKGVMKFTSSDTTYDAEFNPTVTVNPIVGATVTWNYGNTSATYTTNANGEITINAAQLTAGAHAVQIAKMSENGIPLVLRLAPDYTVTIAANNTQPQTTTTINATTQTGSTTAKTEIATPPTGDDGNQAIYLMVISIAVIAITTTIYRRRKYSYEK